MHVEVNDCRAPDQTVAPQRADGDGHVVQDAEALSVVGKGVVSAAREVRADAVSERRARGVNRPRSREQRAAHERLRPGQSQTPQLALRQSARAQARHVVLCVYEQNVGDRGLARLDYLVGRERALREQTVAHKLELAYGEDVALAYVRVVAWSVEDAHEIAISIQHSAFSRLFLQHMTDELKVAILGSAKS